MMRLAVAVLALLAGAKVWTQERMYRSATEDALVSVYKDKATERCRHAAATRSTGTPPDSARTPASEAFAKPATIRLEIGNPEVDVHIWEIDHAAWPMRYKYPYIVLDAGNSQHALRCSYDVTLDKAKISQL